MPALVIVLSHLQSCADFIWGGTRSVNMVDWVKKVKRLIIYKTIYTIILQKMSQNNVNRGWGTSCVTFGDSLKTT